MTAKQLEKTLSPVHYHEGAFPPDKQIDWSELVPYIGPAAAAVARYDGMLATVHNPGILISPLIMHEADMSSRIEGTQATMREALEFEAGREPESPAKRDDIQEIINYREAMFQAGEALKTLPLSLRVLKEAHHTLLSGARGQGKSPGEFRRIQNFIGKDNRIENASYIPISAEKLVDAMSAWEKYIHADTPDLLVQAAVLHAEFEAIHPFLDGNGRLGRMFIPLFLWRRKLIRAPAFYISAYLEAHRDAYIERLLAVSRDNDWTGWARFFLEAVRAQAKTDTEKVEAMIRLYDNMKNHFMERIRSQYALHTLDWIFKKPIFSSSDFIDNAGISAKQTAYRILSRLCDDNILEPFIEARGRQATVYVFPELMSITEGRSMSDGGG